MNYARPVVALSLILCSTAVYYFVLGGTCSVEWKDVVLIIVGALVANLTTVVQYYFGSSTGSSEKTQVMAKLLNGKSPDGHPSNPV